MSRTLKLGISIGDINGIGLEVILKTFKDKRMLDFCTPILFGEIQLINYVKKNLGLDDIYLYKAKDQNDLKAKKINVINCWQEPVKIHFGQSKREGGTYALKSLQTASHWLKKGFIEALVSAPINKDNIQSDNFKFPGHTEFLEQEHEGKALMLMLGQNLRVGVVTGHIPLDKIASTISKELILQKLRIFNASLIQDFGLRKPKIALLGLNPHAGDNGLLGQQEKNIIIPAIKAAEEEGMLAFGPYPADGFFGSSQLSLFDGILAMYHDQGLIPFKTLTFGQGVNFTAGLNIIRTSPDHGTAYNIAGQKNANESSFRQAVYIACDVHKKRAEWQDINKNPLKISN